MTHPLSETCHLNLICPAIKFHLDILSSNLVMMRRKNSIKCQSPCYFGVVLSSKQYALHIFYIFNVSSKTVVGVAWREHLGPVVQN